MRRPIPPGYSPSGERRSLLYIGKNRAQVPHASSPFVDYSRCTTTIPFQRSPFTPTLGLAVVTLLSFFV